MSNTKKDKKEKFLKRFFNKDDINLVVTNIKTSNLENRESSLEINYDLTIKNAVSTFDKELYINLDFDKELLGYNFKKRKLDYVFSSKKMMTSITELTIPDNYNILELPKGIAINTDNYELKVVFEKDKNKIIYKKDFKIKNAIIKTTDFDVWNAFNEDLIKIYNEQIILIKK